MNQSCKVSAFLAKHGVTAAGGSIDVLTRAMLADMESGLEKDPSGLPLEKAGMEPSLEMIPTWTKLPDSVPKNEPVIVIDAGGTNFRSCLVKFDSKGNPEITNLEKCGMPGIKKELSKEEFFDAIGKTVAEKEVKVRIPAYQRPYAWGMREVNQLIQDLETKASTESPYHLGTIILHYDKDETTFNGECKCFCAGFKAEN